MSIKNILVAYPGRQSAQSALTRALSIARHHDAHLTGILGHGTSRLLGRFGGMAPKEVVESLRAQDREEIAEAVRLFQAKVDEFGRTHAAESLEMFDEDGATVASFARTFDLVVTAPQSRDSADEHISANPDLIALQSGRPVLVVPEGYDETGLSTHVVVAWDGKRAAARAIGDAMPVLEEKVKVTVLTVGKAEVPGTRRLVKNLQRHGIDAEHVNRPKAGSTGATILAVSRELGANLIVMGAYEHSKFSHDFFGGTTTDVLREARVPLLMSH